MSSSKNSECVRVAIRCRPLSKKEVEQGFQQVIHMEKKVGRVTIMDSKSNEPPKEYTFDSVYDTKSSQKDIYDDAAFQIVESVLEGFNGTIFAYGQTGTGKTFTMVGADDGTPEKEMRGIIPRAFDHIFSVINATPDRQFHVSASFLEIYNEQIRDLLSKDHKAKLDLRDHPERGTYVKNLSEYTVRNTADLDKLMAKGQVNRAVASTQMNQESSRSHSLFTISIESSVVGADGKRHIRVGKLNMVDLAGSERQSKTGATGEQLKEATNINKSLSALGAVINSLVDGKSSHVPYRDSKLTHLLKDSLGGNTKTVMVANVGPAEYNVDETLATLRYANRAKNIKNKPKINEDPKDTKLRAYEEEIAALRAQLDTGSSRAGPLSEEERKQVAAEVEAEMQSKFDKLEKERKRIEEDKEKTQLEKDHLLEELKLKEKEVEKQREKQANKDKKNKDLQKRLEELQKQVIIGNETQRLVMEQERELVKNREKLKEKERQAAEAKERQEKEAKLKDQLAKECSSKDEMISKLQSKLEKTLGRITELEDQASLLEDEKRQIDQQAEMAEYALFLLDNFVPQTVIDMLGHHRQLDPETRTIVVRHFRIGGRTLRQRHPPPLVDGALRPISQASCHDLINNPSMRAHLKRTNILDASIDMRLPSKYTLAGMDPREGIPLNLRAAVETTIGDVFYEIPDTQPPVYYQYTQNGGMDWAQNDLTVGSTAARFLEGGGNTSRATSGARPASAARR